MASNTGSSPKSFLGVKNAPPRGPFRAALFGKPAAFFRDVVKASAFVELYDEELGVEIHRSGIRTEEVGAGRLGERLKSLSGKPVLSCLVGYPSLPAAAAGPKGQPVILFSPRGTWDGAGGPAALIVGHRTGSTAATKERAPKVITARRLEGGVSPRWPRAMPGGPGAIVIDPLVMDPALFAVPENLEPGGLQWYTLAALLKSAIMKKGIRRVLILPRTLPRRDPGPAFVLARLTAKIMAYALAGETAGR